MVVVVGSGGGVAVLGAGWYGLLFGVPVRRGVVGPEEAEEEEDEEEEATSEVEAHLDAITRLLLVRMAEDPFTASLSLTNCKRRPCSRRAVVVEGLAGQGPVPRLGVPRLPRRSIDGTDALFFFCSDVLQWGRLYGGVCEITSTSLLTALLWS